MTYLNVLGDKKVMALTKDPWYKKPYYIKSPPPWSRYREYIGAILQRPAMARAIAAFALAASETAGIDRWQRRKILAEALRGPGKYGGKPKPQKMPPLPESEVKAKIETIRAFTSEVISLSATEAIARVTAKIKR